MSDLSTIEKPVPSMLCEPPQQTSVATPTPTAPASEINLPMPIGIPCGKLAGAIGQVMQEIGTVAKDGTNKFHNYKYVKVEDLLARVTPLMAKHGVVILQTEVDRSMLDGDKAVAVRYAFSLIHSSGEVWPERLYQTGLSRCRDSKGGFDDKCFNKAHTAARKYMLLALFQVPTGDEADDADDGANDGNGVWGKKGYGNGASVLQPGDYDDGVPERNTKPKTKQDAIFPRTLNAAVTFADRARAMQDELRQCASVVELLELGDEMKTRRDYQTLPDTLKDYIWKTQAKCLAKMPPPEVVHDTDDIEPRSATESDFEAAPDPDEPGSISLRAMAMRDQRQ